MGVPAARADNADPRRVLRHSITYRSRLGLRPRARANALAGVSGFLPRGPRAGRRDRPEMSIRSEALESAGWARRRVQSPGPNRRQTGVCAAGGLLPGAA